MTRLIYNHLVVTWSNSSMLIRFLSWKACALVIENFGKMICVLKSVCTCCHSIHKAKLSVADLTVFLWNEAQNQQNECAPSEDSDQPGHPPSLTVWSESSLCAQWVAKDDKTITDHFVPRSFRTQGISYHFGYFVPTFIFNLVILYSVWSLPVPVSYLHVLESESFRPLSVSPTFPFALSRFTHESFHLVFRSPLCRFAHFPVRLPSRLAPLINFVSGF